MVFTSEMDKSCHSAGDSSTTTATTSSSSSNNRDQHLKQLNRFSHKISKPNQTHIRKPPPFDHNRPNHHQVPPPPQQVQAQDLLPPQQHQPPVYNINKNDFRDVVQRLTGSPSHERISTPPPIHQPKPQSSRLQRIRPPPLAQISNRPPPLMNSNALPQQLPNPSHPNVVSSFSAAGATSFPGQRPIQPLSPLPPFPTVHAAAESPISAYMRYLHNSISAIDSDPKRFSGLSPLAPLVSPRWNNLSQPPPPPLPQHQNPPPPAPASTAFPQFLMPTSPLPFGCLRSPRSPYPLLSPSLLFSPTAQLGFQQLPLSPTMPVPSPRWKGI